MKPCPSFAHYRKLFVVKGNKLAEVVFLHNCDTAWLPWVSLFGPFRANKEKNPPISHRGLLRIRERLRINNEKLKKREEATMEPLFCRQGILFNPYGVVNFL